MHSWIVVYKLNRVLIEARDMAAAWESFVLQFPRNRVKPTQDEVTIRPASDAELLEFSRRRARRPETPEMFDTEPYVRRKARRSITGDVTLAARDAPRRALARTDHPITSHDAARAAQSSSETQRARLLAWLRGVQSIDERFHKGATDEEMAEALRMNPSTQRPRRVELVDEGLIVDSGERRPTRSGRAAIVWAACPF